MGKVSTNYLIFNFKCFYYPTGPFTISELQNLSIDVSELRKVCWSTDFEALKLRKGRSGRGKSFGLINIGLRHRFESYGLREYCHDKQ